MDGFAQLVQGWHVFYATIAASAATLVGLLFVSMALNVGMLAGPDNIGLKKLASQTLLNFLYAIVFSLIFLIPRQTPIGLGAPLICVGIVGLIRTVSNLRDLLSNIPQGVSRRTTLVRAAMALVAFSVLIIVSLLVLLRANAGTLYWLVAPMILLLLSASANTWSLLIGVHEASAIQRNFKD
jgi:hypothetical protein